MITADAPICPGDVVEICGVNWVVTGLSMGGYNLRIEGGKKVSWIRDVELRVKGTLDGVSKAN